MTEKTIPSSTAPSEPTEAQKTLIREAVTLFISTITGMKPPHDREAMPPEIYSSMDMLTLKIWTALSPHSATVPKDLLEKIRHELMSDYGYDVTRRDLMAQINELLNRTNG